MQAPTRIGSIWPSGPALGRAMADQVDLSVPGTVVELGAGTGPVTAALLQAGVPPQRLVSVERDPALARVLRERFPGIRVVEGDAGDLVRLLAREGVDQAAAIVSSLPLVSLPKALVTSVVEGSFALLHPKGSYIQFTYGLVSPIPLRRFHLDGRKVTRAWRNLPPAVVWRYRRQPGRPLLRAA
ncbi:MAG: class I SAM-dependent methyltransferase [Alphaproteobacteria bacterium]